MSKMSLGILTMVGVLVTLPATAADNGERTYMPDQCAERDQNCVKDDGPPPRTPWVHRQTPNNGGNGTNGSNSSGAKNSGTAWASGTAAPRGK